MPEIKEEVVLLKKEERLKRIGEILLTSQLKTKEIKEYLIYKMGEELKEAKKKGKKSTIDTDLYENVIKLIKDNKFKRRYTNDPYEKGERIKLLILPDKIELLVHSER